MDKAYCAVCARQIGEQVRSGYFTTYGSIDKGETMIICEECLNTLSYQERTELERIFSLKARNILKSTEVNCYHG